MSPRVFVSYSHDSDAHRAWVRQLAERLRANGVDVVLDQWDLRAGADLARFMEQGIVEAGRVLMVCTANYVAKAEERKGGVGYEGMIVTGQVARASETIKFVPIVRDNASESLIPAFLGPRLWLDFRDDCRFEERLLELLHELHEVPRYVKPPLGPSPFAPAPPAAAKAPAPDPAPDPPAPAPAVLSPTPSPLMGSASVLVPPPARLIFPLQPAVVTTAQLRRQGSEWRVDRRERTVDGLVQELGEGESLRLIQIAAGDFQMGSPEGEEGGGDDEKPQHEVRLERFFLSQTPITQAQWRAVAQWEPRQGERWGRQLEAHPSRFQAKNEAAEKQERYGSFRLLAGEASADQRPVERVSWEEAMEFCQRLSQRTGRRYTLPSEAQWEYACRAGTTTPFHFGETLTTELANYAGTDVYANGPKGEFRMQTTPVGMFPANAWGLHDMHGNVWEWCLDDWHSGYEGAPTDGTAWVMDREASTQASPSKRQPESKHSGKKLLRGGSWYNDPRDCRSACRSRFSPINRNVDVGFRVCCLPQD